MDQSGAATQYALGHSERELERLGAQARVFGPFTRRMLHQAGLAEGMRVLDVGTGTGDVAFLCADLVGPSGEVVGADRSPAAIETARERARRAGLRHVIFTVDDAQNPQIHGPFDAVVGRLVLMHQPDPVTVLRKLSALTGPRGIVAFQEFDIGAALSSPPSPTFDRYMQWMTKVFTAAGTDARMGLKLHSVFVEAGLPAPSMSLDAGIWGGGNNPAAVMVSDVVRSLLPVAAKLGLPPEPESAISTVRERIEQELRDSGGVAISPSLIGAWTRLD
ncbi:MAG TPA: class I SAM-dependent methyltransferase [Bryobacteraceae bacterium]|nr:class I SAM-dependent methyltransferase [Bryobacteraceae bacterium]